MPKNFTQVLLSKGQIFEAIVASKDGEKFWLKIGEQTLPVISEINLKEGQRIKLVVIGTRGEEILVKKISLADIEEKNGKKESLLKIIEKFGVSEKDVKGISDIVQKLPVESNTAVRYLLDPHLFAALLIPKENNINSFDKIEVMKYKGMAKEQDVWEVNFELEMAVLGHIEIVVKMLGTGLYTQIWASSKETENILRNRKKDVQVFCTNVEIIPVVEGPLIAKNSTENIDFVV